MPQYHKSKVAQLLFYKIFFSFWEYPCLNAINQKWHSYCFIKFKMNIFPCFMFQIPNLHVKKPHFFDKNLSSKIGVRLIHGILFLLTTEPATPVLYDVKLPVETASVWDCYLASYCTCANTPMYYWCIGIFWLHESSRHHRFPEVGRPWHYWQITVNAASDNQSAANAIANILLSHRWNLVRLIYELLFPNSWPKNLGAAYTRVRPIHTQIRY
jgi:hypothetical protein